jgi:hypothetical protein
MHCVIKVSGDNFCTARVTWQENIFADIPLFQMDVVL